MLSNKYFRLNQIAPFEKSAIFEVVGFKPAMANDRRRSKGKEKR
jgi:hypothetical protein